MIQSLGLVIPCYNEELVLPLLFERLITFKSQIQQELKIIFIDDGSRDKTWEMLENFCSLHTENAAAIKLSRNFGHQTAVSAGLKYIQADVIGVLDADLQDPPELFIEMMKKVDEGFHVIYAVRQNRKENFILKFAYWLFYRILKKVANIDMALDSGDFCLMTKDVVYWINQMPEHNRFVRGLRGWVGFKQIGIPYDRAGRAAGETKYSFRKLMGLAMDGLISFSSVPLKFSGWLGVSAAIVGLLYLIEEFVKYFWFERPPSGWASMVGIIVFFGGVQLMMMGIFGQYLGRIFDEVKQRPIFIPEKMSGFLKSVVHYDSQSLKDCES